MSPMLREWRVQLEFGIYPHIGILIPPNRIPHGGKFRIVILKLNSFGRIGYKSNFWDIYIYIYNSMAIYYLELYPLLRPSLPTCGDLTARFHWKLHLASAWKYESQALAEHIGVRMSLMIVKNL